MQQIILAVFSALVLGVAGQYNPNITDDAPMFFLWPAQRSGYGPESDGTEAPCGGIAVGARTDFPITGGALAFIQQDESFDVEVRVAYTSSPGASDFSEVLPEDNELDIGHMCFHVNLKSGVTSGSPGTFQIQYKAGPQNATYYVCADVNFVNASSFTTTIPCFNATEDSGTGSASSSASASASATHASSAWAIGKGSWFPTALFAVAVAFIGIGAAQVF